MCPLLQDGPPGCSGTGTRAEHQPGWVGFTHQQGKEQAGDPWQQGASPRVNPTLSLGQKHL